MKSAPATSHVLWPRPSLGGCVFAAIVRDTRGVALPHEDRFNHLPAGPFCGVTIIINGSCHMIEAPDQVACPSSGPLLAQRVVSGPQRKPTLSWNPGPVYAVTVIFYPDAFAALTGRDVSPLVDSIDDAPEVLPLAVLDLFGAFERKACTESLYRCFRAFEDSLELLWARARPPGHVVSAWLSDWGRSVMARAALSGVGRSARQVERRIKAWTGLTERDLDAFGRGERLFARMGPALQEGNVRWAELATEAGFADQSHMVRRVRRDTGLPPEQLVRAIMNHESFWCYRLLGERY